MNVPGPYPYRGVLIWAAPDDGGRRSGPPPDPSGYAQVAHVPPRTAANGSSSFVLRGFNPTVAESPAEGCWLAFANEGEHHVDPGTTIIIKEGQRVVAHFTVTEIVSEP